MHHLSLCFNCLQKMKELSDEYNSTVDACIAINEGTKAKDILVMSTEHLKVLLDFMKTVKCMNSLNTII